MEEAAGAALAALMQAQVRGCCNRMGGQGAYAAALAALMQAQFGALGADSWGCIWSDEGAAGRC